jgi:HEAT repeat protein
LIARAREWAERLGKRVRLWISDKQEAFLTGIAAEFPDVPHRFCQNHFLRDVAQLMLEADSHAKVRMRSKVRGLRAIEKDLLAAQRAEELRTETDDIPGENIASEDIAAAATDESSPVKLSVANAVVMDYCTAVKGILNDDQGGPLHPPGLRMVDALQSVRGSVERCLATKKGALQKRH